MEMFEIIQVPRDVAICPECTGAIEAVQGPSGDYHAYCPRGHKDREDYVQHDYLIDDWEPLDKVVYHWQAENKQKKRGYVPPIE